MRITICTCDVCKKEKSQKECIGFDSNKTVIRIKYKGYDFDSFNKDICEDCARKIIEFFKKIEKDGI